MKKQNFEHGNSIWDFEHKSRELISLMITLSEERSMSTRKLNSPIGDIMALSAMNAKYALEAFLKLAKIEG